MKNTLHHLLQQKNIEFVDVNKESVLHACVHACMGSEGNNCTPEGR